MARRGDGIYQRGRTWWLDFMHEGKRHVVRLGNEAHMRRQAEREVSPGDREFR